MKLIQRFFYYQDKHKYVLLEFNLYAIFALVLLETTHHIFDSMLRKLLTILALLFLPFFIFSQSIELDWQNDTTIVVGEDSVKALYFDDACYMDGSFLPHYVYSQQISNEEAEHYDFTASISNLSVSSVASTHVKTAFLVDDFQIIYHVSSSRGDYTLDVTILPLKINSGTISRLNSFTLSVDKTPRISLRSTSTPVRFPANSVLVSGHWVKVGIEESGIYRLSYSELHDMGIDPSDVSVFTGQPGKLETMITNYRGDLYELPILDGGDYILFYGQSHDTWQYNSTNQLFEHTQHPFWNENYYYLSSDVGTKKRIKTSEALIGTPTTSYTTFTDYDFYEPQEYSITHSGDDWYSMPLLVGESLSHDFSFPNVASENATMTMNVASFTYSSDPTNSPVQNATKTYIDNIHQADISLASTENKSTSMAANVGLESYNFTPQSNTISAKIVYDSEQAYAKGWLDYFAINVKRDLKIPTNSLLFRTIPTSDTLAVYNVSNAKSTTAIWDISLSDSIHCIPSTLDNGTLSFLAQGDKELQYVAVDTSATYPAPRIVGTVENQDLHGIAVPDLVILTDEKFMRAAEDLALIHRNDGLDVYVTTQEKIFNEFSSGKADVTAIRWFMKMLYDRSTDHKFKYLLLFGDADINNRLYEEGSSIIMSYQSNNSLNRAETYVSDDYFGLLDDNEGNGSNIDKYDKVDIGIGRIPVNTLSEAQEVVNKIDWYKHHSKQAPWKNAVCLVADDQDKNAHIKSADKIGEQIRRDHPAIAVKKVYVDAFEQKALANGNRTPDAKTLVDKYIQDGVLIWGYTGHGSPTQLAEENMMHLNHVNAYTNIDNLPVWMTASCDFCPYDHNKQMSCGERVLLNPNGGGVALFTTTRLVYSSSNETISLAFYKYIFSASDHGESQRLGDVIRLAKNYIGTGVNKRKFAFIGDPALQLNQADNTWEVMTDSINGVFVDKETHVYTDTLKSLSTVTISGYISKSDSIVDTTYNGFVFPIIYDKINTLKTLANDPESYVRPFLMWNSILYQGKAEVIDGRFSFSFILPKDLDYNVGKGRIEYYAMSDVADANGYYEDFLIGDFNPDFEEDNEGPTVDLFMNSLFFEDGGDVNPNPLLIAQVSDKSGIYNAGTSLGHDISITLNNDPSTIKSINSYYESDASDFTKGTVNYSLQDLAKGDYTLSFKIWDMQNNSTTKDIRFSVKDDAKKDIPMVYCYPSPISLGSKEPARFVAGYEHTALTTDIKLNIYDSDGVLLHQLSNYAYTPSKEIYFDWDPSAYDLSNGLYFYRIVITEDGKEIKGNAEKLIIVE